LQHKLYDLKEIKSVLFVRLGKLGDMMIASWIIKRVRLAYPHLRIGLLTRPKSRGLFRYNSDIDIIQTWNPLGLAGLAVAERIRGWDLLVDLNDEPSRRSVFALRLIGPKHSVAFRNQKSEGVFEKTVVTLVKDKSHVLERLGQMALALGIKFRNADLLPVVYLKPGSGIAKDPVVGLNISAGHPSRYWSIDKWAGLALTIIAKFPKFKLCILYSPADARLAAELYYKINAPEKLVQFKAGGLHDFLAAISSCGALVSPDTSAVHAACALGVPVVGLYPEPYWNFVSWKPTSKNSAAIRSTGDTVDAIPLKDVQSAVIQLLKKVKMHG
jgi:ADP-heptose:LPS heptosyltransferase